MTFGLGRKLEVIYDAAIGKLGDAGFTGGEIVANIQNKGFSGALDNLEKKPSFWERYHQTVDPIVQAIDEYHEDKPVEAAGLELGAGVFNPANKVGVGFIKNGTSFANTALRSGVVGSGIGGVAGAMNAERVEDVVPNAFGGSLSGAAIGGALPLATGLAGKMVRPLFTTKKAPITIPTKEQLALRQPLIDQLYSGNYTDIPFGTLPENVRQQVNQIRINNSVMPLQADMIIPAGVVQKWGGNRMLENYSPERIAQIADEVFHSPDVVVSEGDYPHIQKLLKEREEHNNNFVGFISQNPKTGNTVAKTVYQIKRNAKTGRQPVSLQDNLVGRKRLSDLQSIPSKEDIVQNNSKVNKNTPNLKRIADFWNNYGRRYSPQYLTPYLAQYLANQQ